MAHYYLVRARDTEIFDKIFAPMNVVGVGWSAIDFTRFSDPAKLHDEIWDVYYKGQGFAPSTVGRSINSAIRFKEIQAGDKIIVNRPGAVVLATAKDGEIYDPSLSASYDTANLRNVDYLKNDEGEILEIPRVSLSHGLQSRLRMPGSIVVNLDNFDNEINWLFSHGKDAYVNAYNANLIKQINDIHRQMLDNIQHGKTQLQAGGAGLEVLIRGLLNSTGYEARILPKTRFPQGADADIEATRDDRLLGEVKILVQVKHNLGTSGPQGVQQLINALQQPGYEEYRGIFITSADDVDANARALANKHDIIVLTGDDVVNMIFENQDKLDQELISKLGLYSAPQIFSY